jgi:hypothetical protein
MGSWFGGMSAGRDRWWYEGRCPYPDPQDRPVVASPVPSCYVTCTVTLLHSPPPTRQRQRRVFDLPFCFFEDVQSCSLLYDVMREIYNTLYLIRFHMPPSASCFCPLTLLSPISPGADSLQQLNEQVQSDTVYFLRISGRCRPNTSNVNGVFEHVLLGSSTHSVFWRPRLLLTSPLVTNPKVAERVDISVNRSVVVGHHRPMRDHCIPCLT